MSIADVSVMLKVMLCYGLAAVPVMLRLGHDEPLWLAALPLSCWLAFKMARPYLPHVAGLLYPGAPRGWAAEVLVGSFLAGLLITAAGVEVVTMLFGNPFAPLLLAG